MLDHILCFSSTFVENLIKFKIYLVADDCIIDQIK